MTGNDYERNLTGLIVATHSYYTASGLDPMAEDAYRIMTSKAIESGAYALALWRFHNLQDGPTAAATAAYTRLVRRWRVTARAAAGHLEEGERATFAVIIEQQREGEDLRPEAIE